MFHRFGIMHLSDFNDQKEQLGGALVATISMPKPVTYLSNCMCPGEANAWDCADVMNNAIGVICNDLR